MTSSSSFTPPAVPAARLLLVVAASLVLLSSQVAVVAQAPVPPPSVFKDDTTGAPFSVGNVFGSTCDSWSSCQNDCRSIFYKVTGASGTMTASSCGTTNFQQRFYVWKGTGSACSTFTCEGTHRMAA